MVERLEWKHQYFDMPLHTKDREPAYYEAILSDPAVGTNRKYLAAIKYHKLTDGITTYPFRLSLLRLGAVSILFLPGEMCVEYQFYAKRRSRSRLAVAAYGDSFLNYIATDEAFNQGAMRWTRPGPRWTGDAKA